MLVHATGTAVERLTTQVVRLAQRMRLAQAQAQQQAQQAMAEQVQQRERAQAQQSCLTVQEQQAQQQREIAQQLQRANGKLSAGDGDCSLFSMSPASFLFQLPA